MNASTGFLVLVVEDDPIIGMMLRDMLLEIGCRSVGPAGSVRAALKLLEGTPSIDAALLDCNLGREMVWPVADRLRSCNIPFVFSTGYGQVGVDPRFAGIPVLNKPFPPKMLGQVLATILKPGP